MLTIGICGASGSGKSTLAQALSERLEGGVVLLSQDCYYLDHSSLPMEERRRVNYDDPNAFEHDLLLADVQTLRAGGSISRKGYDFAHHMRADSAERIQPAKALILDGIHVFHDPRLRALMDLRLYVKVDPDICLLRRIRRDIVERERDIADIERQYLATVRPMYEKHIAGYIQYADVIVAEGGRNQKIVEILAGYLNAANESQGEE